MGAAAGAVVLIDGYSDDAKGGKVVVGVVTLNGCDVNGVVSSGGVAGDISLAA